jgi:hypothetical protein
MVCSAMKTEGSFTKHKEPCGYKTRCFMFRAEPSAWYMVLDAWWELMMKMLGKL